MSLKYIQNKRFDITISIISFAQIMLLSEFAMIMARR